MTITLSPVEQRLEEIAGELDCATETLSIHDRPALTGIAAGQTACRALQAIHEALNDLEPGAAVTVLRALENGLGVTA